VDGVWVSWGTEGFGVSSAAVDFNYTIAKGDTVWSRNFTVTQTVTVTVESSCQTINETAKQTTATIQVTRNGAPTAAQVTLLIDQNGTWLTPNYTNDYLLVDHGDGAYTATFSTAASDAENILAKATTPDGVNVQASVANMQAP
jgi:archaellum component FlaF (FlaF/FlaG flagellin family)